MEQTKLVYPVVLDIEKDGLQKTVCGFFDADTGEKTLCIVLTLGGTPYRIPDGCTAAFCAKKADNSLLRHSCTVRDSKVYYTPGVQLLSPAGETECQVILFGTNGRIICAPRFKLQTGDALWNGEIPDEPAASELLNWDVLGALSSPDGKQLLLHGEPVGVSAYAQTFALLPQGSEGMLAYVETSAGGHPQGFYRFAQQWEYLPVYAEFDETLIPLVDTLPQTAAQGDVVYLRNSDFYAYQNGAWHLVQDADAHTHANINALNKITGDVLPIVNTLPPTASAGDAVYLRGHGLYRYAGGTWTAQTIPTSLQIANTFAELQPMQEGMLYYVSTNNDHKKGFYTCRNGYSFLLASADDHIHPNGTLLNKFTSTDCLRYDGQEIPLIPVDDVQLLESTSYERMYFASDLEAVPWMVLGSNATVVIQDANGTQSIQLSESNDSVTGLPVRQLDVTDGENSYSYCSRASGADATYTPAGWLDENGDACAAPALSGFTPSTMLFRSETYALSNVAAWSREAYLSLWTLSQMVHTSANRVDHPYVPEDAVLRFTGEIVPNRKYAFSTETDFTLNLNEIEWTGEDAQFVLYLYATGYYDVDITFDGEGLTQDSTFDGDPLFIGGVPEIKTGAHKLIGYWDEQARRWAVGCLDAEEES